MNELKYFGHVGNVDDPLGFFQEQNYIICRGATELGEIDNLMDFYNTSIVNSRKQYVRQSTRWEYHQKTPEGGMINPFLNPHSFEKGINGQFSDKILKVLSCQRLQKALSEITGKDPTFRLFQTMIFDHSITTPHQDWVFLDSRPNGHLVAAWVALEDIHPQGIRFYVYPGTHNFMPKVWYNKVNIKKNQDIYADFFQEIGEYLDSNSLEMYAPPLKKGDVFFWGSRIIHGSTRGTNPKLRRRSIAAHLVPEGFRFGNLERDFDVAFKQKYGLDYVYRPLDKQFSDRNSSIKNSVIYRLLKKTFKN